MLTKQRYKCLMHYIGGKYHQLKTILSYIPKHTIYVELFGGAGSVLINKEPSKVEVYNDINQDLYNLFKVLRDNFNEFYKSISSVIYSRDLYNEYLRKYKTKDYKDNIEKAVVFYYLTVASYGSVIRTFYVAKCKNASKTFWNKIDLLPEIHDRLKNVVIENKDYKEIIKQFDSRDTFFFIDPPYHPETEKHGNKEYNYYLTIEEYKEMIEIINNLKGKWMLCGFYHSDYEKLKYKKYITVERVLFQGNQDKHRKKEEYFWMNYEI